MKYLLTTLLLFLFTAASFTQTGEELKQSALKKLEQKDYAYAMGLIEKAIEKDSTNGMFYVIKGLIHNRLEEFDSAEENMELAMQVDSQNFKVFIEAAEYFSTQNEIKKAIKLFDKALEINPSEKHDIYNRKANTYWSVMDFESASILLDEILKKEPDNLAALHNYAVIYHRTNQTDKAIEYSERIIKIDPQNTNAIMNLGFYYSSLNQPDQAIIYYNRALEQRPEADLAYNNRGYAYYQLGEYRKALQDIEKSIKMYSSNSYAYRNLALVYIALDKKNEACKALEFAKMYQFEVNYGNEVNELLEKHCR